MSAVPSRISRACNQWFALILLTACCMMTASGYAGEVPSATPLAIANGSGTIGFDDLGFSSALRKVIVPAAQTGKLFLIDPGSNKMEEIGGFSTHGAAGGSHGGGVTSADVGHGALFTADRGEQTLDVVDPGTKTILSKAKLASGPDYVRFVAPTNEVWVTEPHRSQIEIFSLPEHGLPEPTHAAVIKIADGPESLMIDGARGRAYANLWTDSTLAIDLQRRTVVARWKNGCNGSRGLALDPVRGFLFIGCKEGKLEVLSLKDGRKLGEVSSGDGVEHNRVRAQPPSCVPARRGECDHGGRRRFVERQGRCPRNDTHR